MSLASYRAAPPRDMYASRPHSGQLHISDSSVAFALGEGTSVSCVISLPNNQSVRGTTCHQPYHRYDGSHDIAARYAVPWTSCLLGRQGRAKLRRRLVSSGDPALLGQEGRIRLGKR